MGLHNIDSVLVLKLVPNHILTGCFAESVSHQPLNSLNLRYSVLYNTGNICP